MHVSLHYRQSGGSDPGPLIFCALASPCTLPAFLLPAQTPARFESDAPPSPSTHSHDTLRCTTGAPLKERTRTATTTRTGRHRTALPPACQESLPGVDGVWICLVGGVEGGRRPASQCAVSGRGFLPLVGRCELGEEVV